MAFLKDKDKKQIVKAFGNLENEVKLIVFTQEVGCQNCEIAREMVEEIAQLSERVTLEVFDFVKDAALAKEYGVDKVPAIVVQGERDYGIRFFGVPSGYEFTTLIEGIVDVSRRDPGLPSELVAELDKVDQPVHMQVMTSPT